MEQFSALKNILNKGYKVVLIVLLLVGFTATVFITQFQTKNIVNKGKNGVKASEILNTYYVALNGNDTNSGSQTAPFKTFAKATSVLKPGETLMISGGTYNTPLDVSVSGTNIAPIHIKQFGEETVVIDVQKKVNYSIRIRGNYIELTGPKIIATGSNWAGIQASGHDIVVDSIEVTKSKSHGIVTSIQTGAPLSGSSITVKNCIVHENMQENNPPLTSNQWGSALKVEKGSSSINFERNSVFHNYGEGIAVTRGNKVSITQNRVYDNYSVNIYVDNSFDIIVNKNFVTCSPNSGFERDGSRASGITLSEEFYTGWGAQLARIDILNNIFAFCNHGIYYYDTGIAGGGLDSARIINNTFWGSVGTALTLDNAPTKTKNNIIANNIIQQPNGKLIWVPNASGMVFKNNYWVSPGSPSSQVVGVGDKSGDVKLASVPFYSPESFKLSTTSSAIDAGASGTVSDDYFGTLRPQLNGTDIGAIEYDANSTQPVISPIPSLMPTLIPSLIPTSTPIPMNTPIPTTSLIPSNSPLSGIKRESFNSGSISTKTTSVSTLTDVRIPSDNKKYLYLAAISTKPNIPLGNVDGLGLVWTKGAAQCSGKSAARTEIWWAYGLPTSSGKVSATFTNTTNLKSAVIAVTAYSGAALPLANISSKNSIGVNTLSCTGGTDQKIYTNSFFNSASGSMIFGAVSLRQYSHSPDSGITEIGEVHSSVSNNGDNSGIAVVEKYAQAKSIQTISGAFSQTNDYAYIGLEILPN
jgi:hypothetical protein